IGEEREVYEEKLDRMKNLLKAHGINADTDVRVSGSSHSASAVEIPETKKDTSSIERTYTAPSKAHHSGNGHSNGVVDPAAQDAAAENGRLDHDMVVDVETQQSIDLIEQCVRKTIDADCRLDHSERPTKHSQVLEALDLANPHNTILLDADDEEAQHHALGRRVKVFRRNDNDCGFDWSTTSAERAEPLPADAKVPGRAGLAKRSAEIKYTPKHGVGKGLLRNCKDEDNPLVTRTAPRALSRSGTSRVPAFKYTEVVRDKETRKRMHGSNCPCCVGVGAGRL
ncbi:hypothetical protein HDU91_003916, partial [Kappamyces sp. JEL0680]